MDGVAEAVDRVRQPEAPDGRGLPPLRVRHLIAALAVLGALAGAPTAQAGTAHGDTYVPTCSGFCKYFDDSPILRVVYTAAAGESNVVSTDQVSTPAGDSVSVRDQGADVFASGRCERLGAREARCGPGSRVEETVRTGDRDDVVEGFTHAVLGAGDDTGRAPHYAGPPPTPGTQLDGEEGADVLTGGGGLDFLRGGEGNDRLAGRDDGDFLFGGSGRDRLSGGLLDDVVKGGRGRDRVAGGPGDDQLSGGTGDDRVGGDAGRDRVFGRGGNDLIRGGSGSDRLSGGGGRDRIAAGSGDDRVAARDKRRDRVRCGRGRDAVTADRFDVLIGCETARLPRR